MIKAKKHLKNVFRTRLSDFSRSGYLRLDMNESPSGLPNGFIRKMLKQIDNNLLGRYPEYNKLQKAIARHNNINEENICLANGSDAAIKYIFDAFVARNDRVLLTEPTFAMYPVYSKIFQATVSIIEYNRDLSFPGELFLKNISSNVRLAVIVNPNNPTGSVIEKSLLMEIIRKAHRKGVLLIVDEAYFYYYPESVVNEINNFSNLVVLRTFSKLCGIAALRIGYACAARDIVESIRKVKPTYDINSVAVIFAQGILSEHRVVKDLISEFRTGKEFILKRLKEKKIPFIEGKANFVLIKCPQDIDRLISSLSKKRILVGGKFKHDFLKDYIRVTIGKREMMEIFWKTFITLYERYSIKNRPEV